MSEKEKLLKNGQLFNTLRKNKPSEKKKEKLQKHLNEGADVNAKDANDNNNSPLHISVLNGDLDIVRFLLEKKANINSFNSNGVTPLDIAKLPQTINGQAIVNVIEEFIENVSKTRLDNLSLDENLDQSISSEVVQPDKSSNIESSKTSKKRKAGTVEGLLGYLYEMKLSNLILSKALNKKEMNTFYLNTNTDKIGCFDDLIFKYHLNGQNIPTVIFIQAKHKASNKAEINSNNLYEEKGDFSLQKYFHAYIKIREKFDNNSDNDIIFSKTFENVDCYFIIYTPAKITFDCKKFDELYENKNEETKNKIDRCYIEKYNNFLLKSSITGKVSQLEEISNVEFLVKNTSSLCIKQLGIRIAQLILTGKSKHMMGEEIIKKYHPFLAKNVIQVIQGKKDARIGKFLPSFFIDKDHNMKILRDALFEETVKIKRLNQFLKEKDEDIIENLLKNIINEPHVGTKNIVTKLVKLVGNVLLPDHKKIVKINKKYSAKIMKLKDDLKKVQITEEMLKEAIAIAAKEELSKIGSFLVPNSFGNIDFKIESSNVKRLSFLSLKFKELLYNSSVTEDYVVKIDEKIENTKIRVTIGSLVGNLLVADEQSQMLKFNTDEKALPKNAKELYDNLKIHIPRTEELSRYRFLINVLEFPKLSLAAENKEEEMYRSLAKDFIDRLWFYTEQAEQNQLKESVVIEIDKYYHNDHKINDYSIFHVRSEAIFLQFHEYIQDWWLRSNEKCKVHLEKSDIIQFFQQVKRDILASPLLNVLNFIYVNNIKKHDYNFNKNAFKNFQFDKSKELVNIIADETVFTAIKLIQYFKTIGAQTYYFIDFDYVTAQLAIEHQTLIHEIKKSKPLALIIVCNNCENKDVFEKLKEYVREITFTKLFLVTKSLKSIQLQKGENTDIYDNQNDLTKLTDESQIRILRRGKVIFQGEERKLGTIINDDSKCLINGRALFKLMRGEKLVLGKTVTNSKYNEIKNYYISQNITRYVTVKQEFTTLFNIAGRQEKKDRDKNILFICSSEVKRVKKDQDVILISRQIKHFTKLCNRYKNNNIHWFIKESSGFIWKQSHGSLKKIFQYLNRDNESVEEELQHMNKDLLRPKTLTDLRDNIMIISAKPGMGKSSLLSYLSVNSTKIKRPLWIVRINLMDYRNLFNYWKIREETLDIKECVELVYDAAGFKISNNFIDQIVEESTYDKNIINILKDKVALNYDKENYCYVTGIDMTEIELFTYYYNQSKVILLLDGLDEVSPMYKNEVINFILIMKNTRINKMLITTRFCAVLDELEEKLNMFTYTVNPFSFDDQRSFLQCYWKESLGYKEITTLKFAIFFFNMYKIIYDIIPAQINNMFSRIPLHLFMLARLFQGPFKTFYDSEDTIPSRECFKKFNKEFDLITLYEYFCRIKFYDILYGEKKPHIYQHLYDDEIKDFLKQKYKEFVENHKRMAVYVIVGEKKLSQLYCREDVIQIKKLVSEKLQSVDNNGIIEVIHNELRFIHHTFAEYFSAKYICDTIKTSKSNDESIWNFLIDTIFLGEHRSVLFFVESAIQKDKELRDRIQQKNKENKDILLVHSENTYNFFISHTALARKKKEHKLKHVFIDHLLNIPKK